jgi:hypothetical protein
VGGSWIVSVLRDLLGLEMSNLCVVGVACPSSSTAADRGDGFLSSCVRIRLGTEFDKNQWPTPIVRLFSRIRTDTRERREDRICQKTLTHSKNSILIDADRQTDLNNNHRPSGSPPLCTPSGLRASETSEADLRDKSTTKCQTHFYAFNGG